MLHHVRITVILTVALPRVPIAGVFSASICLSSDSCEKLILHHVSAGLLFRITEGRCNAQAVSCRSVTARSRLQSQTHLCWVFGDENCIATRLSSSSSVLPCVCVCADAHYSLSYLRRYVILAMYKVLT